MNYRQIEELKAALSYFMKQGCSIQIPVHEVDARLIGVGFKPYWTNPSDSKIENLEMNLIDKYGRVIPFNFYNVIGYDIVSKDGQRIEEINNISLDIHVYSANKSREEEPFDKVHMDVSKVTKG